MVEGKLRKISQCSSAFLAALAGVVTGITTALYTVAQQLNDLTAPAIRIQSTGTNQNAELDLVPSGTARASKLRLYTNPTPDNANTLSLIAFDTGAELYVGAADLSDDFLINISGNAGLKTYALKQDGTISLPGAVHYKSMNGLPTATEIPDGCFDVYKNTADSKLYVAANSGGTIKKVELT